MPGEVAKAQRWNFWDTTLGRRATPLGVREADRRQSPPDHPPTASFHSLKQPAMVSSAGPCVGFQPSSAERRVTTT